MNISKVSLFNFDGVEGLVEATIEQRLCRIPPPLVRGIRFLLDRTFCYRNDNGLVGQYVQLTIKYQDEALQLTRHVDTPDYILMDQRQVPVRIYFWDLGETLARIDADWLADVVAFSNKHWMDLLTRSTVQQGQTEAPIDLNLHEHIGLAQWKSFRSRRLERVERLVERNDLIKRCRSIGKCRNQFLKRSIGDVEHSLSHITGQMSQDCNALQAQAHALAQDIVSDQTKVFAALQSVTALYHDVDMDVVEELSQLYQTVQNEAHQVSSSISAVNASQRQDYQAVVQGSVGTTEETKEFRLQFTTGCLELARMPGEAHRKNALEEERLRLNERYSAWDVDYRAAQGRLEEQLQRNEQYVHDLDGAAEQLDADLSDWLVAMEQVNRRNKTLLKDNNRRAVDKIALRAHLEEIRTVLASSTADYDAACQHGMSSVLRLLEGEEYAVVKQSEFLGPIFESIRFKQDTDIVLQTYFRAKLQSWHSVLVVRSVAFAHRLVTDFNARRLRGTISIMACDNYRRPADDLITNGITLADVLDIGEGHPLLPFFSTLVYDAAAEWPEDLSEAMRDPLTGGLTLRTIDYPVAGVQYEKLLQQYYSVDQELVALEQYKVPVEEIERSVRVQVQVMDARLRDLTGVVRSAAQILQRQRAVQTDLLYLGRIKDALTGIDLRQRINGKLIDLVARGGLELSPSTYAVQIEGLLGTPATGPGSAPSGTLVALYDPSNTCGQLEYLQFVMDFHVQSSSFWPVLPTAIVRETCCYVDREIPVEECVTELTAAHRGQLDRLHEHYRSVLRWKRTRRMYESLGRDIHVDPSRTLSTREHLGKPLAELDGELRRMGAEYNVRVRSRAYPKRVINCARRIRDSQQGLGTDAIQQSLRNYMACEKAEPQLDLVNRLWPHVKHFYDQVRPDGLSEVELVWQAKGGWVAGRHLSFKDMDGVEVVLRSASQGQFSMRELGPRAQQVFGIAVLYAKLKINDIRVVTVSSDIEEVLASETLRGILNLLSANDIQILLH